MAFDTREAEIKKLEIQLGSKMNALDAKKQEIMKFETEVMTRGEDITKREFDVSNLESAVAKLKTDAFKEIAKVSDGVKVAQSELAAKEVDFRSRSEALVSRESIISDAEKNLTFRVKEFEDKLAKIKSLSF